MNEQDMKKKIWGILESHHYITSQLYRSDVQELTDKIYKAIEEYLLFEEILLAHPKPIEGTEWKADKDGVFKLDHGTPDIMEEPK